jgi:hypothetical protein
MAASPESSHQLRAQLHLSLRRIAQQNLFHAHFPLRLRYLFLHISDSHLELHNAGKSRSQFLLERRVRRIDVSELFLKALRVRKPARNVIGEFDYRAHLCSPLRPRRA